MEDSAQVSPDENRLTSADTCRVRLRYAGGGKYETDLGKNYFIGGDLVRRVEHFWLRFASCRENQRNKTRG